MEVVGSLLKFYMKLVVKEVRKWRWVATLSRSVEKIGVVVGGRCSIEDTCFWFCSKNKEYCGIFAQE